MPSPNLKLLLSRQEIAVLVKRLAQEIDVDYQSRAITVLVVLKGALLFSADLIRESQTPVERLETIHLASYGASVVSSGAVTLKGGLNPQSLAGRDVLVIEDLVDTGLSLQALLSHLEAYQLRSLRVCALLDKPGRRRTSVRADYVGCVIPDVFVVGYGMDYAEQYRQLPAIYTLGAGG
ncbi:MAG: hypoxanthine phosphoribosyltransferase [Cyanobacteriota bacterium]|jgi:hypoxanthine phosphoribosyltransferase